MRLPVFFAFLVFPLFAAVGQSPPSSPPPQPNPTPAATPPPQRQLPIPIRSQPGMDRIPNPFPLNPVSESDRLATRVMLVQRLVAPLYRKPTGKELDAIAPDVRLQTTYADVLRMSNTGIVRLVPDAGCAANLRVINAREDCLKYSMPGAGNSFSFRTGNYRVRHLADITYSGGELQLSGIFMHAIVTDLGDLPVGEVSQSTPGMKFLADFKPSSSIQDVGLVDQAVTRGIDAGGFHYAKSVRVNPGSTYGYRGVAYRGKVVKSVDGLRYNELDYDDREDVIVVFRVVEVAKDNSITIVWRVLDENETPKLKLPSRNGKDGSDDPTGGQ